MAEKSAVTLYGRQFIIGFSKEDDTRRKAYFKNAEGTLTPQEKQVLTSLGIDSQMEETLRPYLAEFFQSLAICNSDTALLLNKDCETAYFVIWSTMFANRKEIERRLAEAQAAAVAMSDLDVAQTGALIAGLRPRGPVVGPGASAAAAAVPPIDQLFTLMLQQPAPVKPIDELFTLMIEPTVAN